MANYKTEEGTPLFEEGEKMHDENCDLLDQLNEYSDEDKDIEQGEEEEEGDYWYVCYQDEEHDMTWNKFKNEKVARDGYETYQGKKARILYYNAVVEKDGDKTLTESMKEFADKTYIKDTLNRNEHKNVNIPGEVEREAHYLIGIWFGDDKWIMKFFEYRIRWWNRKP